MLNPKPSSKIPTSKTSLFTLSSQNARTVYLPCCTFEIKPFSYISPLCHWWSTTSHHHHTDDYQFFRHVHSSQCLWSDPQLFGYPTQPYAQSQQRTSSVNGIGTFSALSRQQWALFNFYSLFSPLWSAKVIMEVKTAAFGSCQKFEWGWFFKI